jgi:hypothetical protein
MNYPLPKTDPLSFIPLLQKLRDQGTSSQEIRHRAQILRVHKHHDLADLYEDLAEAVEVGENVQGNRYWDLPFRRKVRIYRGACPHCAGSGRWGTDVECGHCAGRGYLPDEEELCYLP